MVSRTGLGVALIGATRLWLLQDLPATGVEVQMFAPCKEMTLGVQKISVRSITVDPSEPAKLVRRNAELDQL